jgi:hypothetical protein
LPTQLTHRSVFHKISNGELAVTQGIIDFKAKVEGLREELNKEEAKKNLQNIQIKDNIYKGMSRLYWVTGNNTRLH